MLGAATFLASPWGGGSDAARKAKRVVCCYHTTQHTHTLTRGAWRPWITLGAPRRTGVGWACLPRARRQGKSQKMKPVLPSSHRRPFLASHPSAPGGSFAFGMMKCHARCALPGRKRGACDRPSFGSSGEMQLPYFFFLHCFDHENS